MIKTIFEIIKKSLLEKIIHLECYTIFMRDLYNDYAGSKNSNYCIHFSQSEGSNSRPNQLLVILYIDGDVTTLLSVRACVYSMVVG